MIGFRVRLSTQDAMKQIKHKIVDGRSSDVRDLLGLDLEKDFDNVLHTFIVKIISDLNRKAKLRIGDFRSEEVPLGGRGTPQGAVISPTLFDICMIGLSDRSARVEDVEHTIYTDDITIWCSGGCEGRVEEAMQEAIDLIEDLFKLLAMLSAAAAPRTLHAAQAQSCAYF
ncbi:uncharacterized protein [Dermacentor albipictus]|uniref:uncharacterized protein n=1 Tax=Dermacentor albipictus TaxID=60249 RepID=UPI0031FDA7F6